MRAEQRHRGRVTAKEFAQAEGRDAATPADQVNRSMDWAMSMLKSNPDVKAQTLGYRSGAIYKDNKIRGWRVNQSLRLEGRDGRLLGDLISELQTQLKVQSIDYQVSDERRREHLDELTADQRRYEIALAPANGLGAAMKKHASLKLVGISVRPAEEGEEGGDQEPPDRGLADQTLRGLQLVHVPAHQELVAAPQAEAPGPGAVDLRVPPRGGLAEAEDEPAPGVGLDPRPGAEVPGQGREVRRSQEVDGRPRRSP